MRNKGFTLIELIVVIAVLAILVTIGVPRYLGHTKEASFTKLKHDARIIQDASDRYYIDNNDWPYLLDENGNKLIVSNPKELTIIYKVEEYNESDLGTDPENDIVLYEIDFDKLKPYIRKLNSDIAYFVAAQGNPEFGITALDPKSESNKDRINIPINEGTPEGPGEVGKAIREPGEGEIVITTAEDLAKIGKGYPLNGSYIQMSDIDLSGYRDGGGWVPIGDDTNRFTGKFDGNGFKIRNLYINRSGTNYQGLFGRTNGATLTNIPLENVDVTGKSYTGGLVGRADNSTEISNSYATGEVTGNSSTGGLVGYAYSSTPLSTRITNSYATGSVTGTSYTGGLVGQAYRSTITNSYATGEVTGKENYTGGLVGSANESTITNSYATGEVTGEGNYTGGLVGWVDSSTIIEDSYATSSVKGTGKYYTGGLVGRANSSTITNSYATGSVTGKDYTGGLVGAAHNSTKITNSYATGSVTGSDDTGGLVGYAVSSPTNITNSYWNTETTGQSTSAGGEGKTTDEMKKKDTYIDWDFDEVWKIDEGKSYPTLR